MEGNIKDIEKINGLIAKAKAGDGEAEAQLLEAYSRLVKSIAFSYYLTCADRDSDDLVQVGMIALLRAIRSFDPSGAATFDTYAAHCVRNAIIDELRKSPEPSLPLDETMEAPDSSHPALFELAEAISSRLTPVERQVLELRLEAMSYDEIAKKLGIQRKKVDNLIMSAKKKLKTFLE